MAYVTNFSQFNPEECGLLFPGQPQHYPFTTNIQKSSINTVDSFCMNPFGAVSNLDCPDWDPACNCWITQYMPNEPEPSGISLADLKKKTSECSLIKTKLQGSGWIGMDFSNPQCLYNCYGDTLTSEPALSPTPIDYYKIDKASLAGSPEGITFLYSIGISGISGISLISDYKNDQVPDKITKTPWKSCGSCFPYYTEYSKTNATFWGNSLKTPLLRKGQVGSYNSTKIKILVNGDSRVKTGMMVNLSIPVGGETEDKLTQKRFSGRWLIYRVERILTTFKHSMYLYLMRDGFSIEPTTALNLTGNISNLK